MPKLETLPNEAEIAAAVQAMRAFIEGAEQPLRTCVLVHHLTATVRLRVEHVPATISETMLEATLKQLGWDVSGCMIYLGLDNTPESVRKQVWSSRGRRLRFEEILEEVQQ